MERSSSILNTKEVQKVYEAASSFASAYTRLQVYPNNHGLRARTLTFLGLLEAEIDVLVSRETSEVEAKLDGSTETPPF